jgi:hypothetical protein
MSPFSDKQWYSIKVTSKIRLNRTDFDRN